MDTDLILAVLSSLGVSMAGVYWLSRTLIQHQLLKLVEKRKFEFSQQLETHKLALSQQLEVTRAEMQRDLARDKAAIDGSIRREVESFLGQVAAQRQYEFDARRRLYLAIGPLRFQLLLACRELAGRIESIGRRENYCLSLDGYYGKSTLYRLLRPLALAEAIEDQVALSDFTVDPSAVECLRFRRSLTRILSGDELVHDHPGVNWNAQEQHVYADSLSVCAQVLILRREKEVTRVLRFDEFTSLLAREGRSILAPFDSLMQSFNPQAKPVLWLRLVAYGQACNALISRHGADIGFMRQIFPSDTLLQHSRDTVVTAALDKYLARITALELVPL